MGEILGQLSPAEGLILAVIILGALALFIKGTE